MVGTTGCLLKALAMKLLSRSPYVEDDSTASPGEAVTR